jgi:hypothetical protein
MKKYVRLISDAQLARCNGVPLRVLNLLTKHPSFPTPFKLGERTYRDEVAISDWFEKYYLKGEAVLETKGLREEWEKAQSEINGEAARYLWVVAKALIGAWFRTEEPS